MDKHSENPASSPALLGGTWFGLSEMAIRDRFVTSSKPELTSAMIGMPASAADLRRRNDQAMVRSGAPLRTNDEACGVTDRRHRLDRH